MIRTRRYFTVAWTATRRGPHGVKQCSNASNTPSQKKRMHFMRHPFWVPPNGGYFPQLSINKVVVHCKKPSSPIAPTCGPLHQHGLTQILISPLQIVRLLDPPHVCVIAVSSRYHLCVLIFRSVAAGNRRGLGGIQQLLQPKDWPFARILALMQTRHKYG